MTPIAVTESEVLAPSRLPALLEFAVSGLERMFRPDLGVFCHRVVNLGGRLVMEGVSPRYTAMTLLGLNRYEAFVGRQPYPIRDLAASLVRRTDWIENAGDIGLSLWLGAQVVPDELDSLLGRLSPRTALNDCPVARSGSTMEVSWLLTGLAEAMRALPRLQGDLSASAAECYALLVGNQGSHGLFGHLQSGSGAAGRLRGRIGSFADQVYPICALSTYVHVHPDGEFLRRATACARSICGHQGALGQWWWHYDSSSGRVVQRYPVYSVHQDAMAPMALHALADAGGPSFPGAIAHGLEWIYGQNELRLDLRDSTTGLVWRSIKFTGRARMIQQEALLFARGGAASAAGLHVLEECRPYHLGWLLYAFARAATSPDGDR